MDQLHIYIDNHCTSTLQVLGDVSSVGVF